MIFRGGKCILEGFCSTGGSSSLAGFLGFDFVKYALLLVVSCVSSVFDTARFCSFCSWLKEVCH